MRKAIKLTLLEPDNAEFRRFTDRLLEIYYAARRVQNDGRLGDAGRARKVAELDDEIVELCFPMWSAELPKLEGANDDYRLLCNELMKLMLAQELFTFVTAAPVTTPTGAVVPVAGTTTPPNVRSAIPHKLAARAARTKRSPVPGDKRSTSASSHRCRATCRPSR